MRQPLGCDTQGKCDTTRYNWERLTKVSWSQQARKFQELTQLPIFSSVGMLHALWHLFMIMTCSIFLLVGWKLKEGLCSLCVSLSLACLKTCRMHRLQAESKPYLLLSMLPFWLQQACRLLCLGSNVSMSEPSLFMRRALLLQPSCPTLVFQLCSLPARLKHVRSNTKLPWYYWSW